MRSQYSISTTFHLWDSSLIFGWMSLTFRFLCVGILNSSRSGKLEHTIKLYLYFLEKQILITHLTAILIPELASHVHVSPKQVPSQRYFAETPLLRPVLSAAVTTVIGLKKCK